MKVYERNEIYNFTYPEDMNKIINYLDRHGKVLVNYSTIQDLYYDFSDEKYCAGWMSVDEERLEEFEDWLTEINI